MSVLQRVRIVSQERVDLPDFLNLGAFANADWAAFIDQFVTGTESPLIVAGFAIPDPDTYVTQQASTIPVRIASSVMFHPTSAGGAGAFYIATDAEPDQDVALTANQTNFIEADQTTSTGSPDTRAIWDEAGGADGEGEEFKQVIDTVTNLDVVVTANTVGFTAGKVPIAKVVLNSNGVVTSITDCRNLLFRLGTGGTSPDPTNRFSWPDGRVDRAVTLTTADPTLNPFEGSDKAIATLKQWMDAVMSRLAELQGPGAMWFEGGSSGSSSISDLYVDSVGSVLTSSTGAGKFTWNAGTNTLAWTTDIYVQSLSGPYNFLIEAASVAITTGDVAYITQERNLPFPTASDSLSWTNGATFVNGNPLGGSFDGLESDTTSAASRGDWIKKDTDTFNRYCRILDFYDAPGGAGGAGALTTAALAVSVELASAYGGTTDTAQGNYAKGAYTITSAAGSGIAFNTNNYILASRWGSLTGKLYVREAGEMEDGEEKDIGDDTSDDLLTFVGATSESDNDPNYTATVTGAVAAPNWETTNGESLTARAAKLNGLAASFNQDRNLVLVTKTPSTLVANFVWDGTDLLWEELYISLPGDDELRNKIGNQTATSGGLTDLAAGECIYVDIHRDAGANDTLTAVKATISSLDPTSSTSGDVTRVILARRIGDEIFTHSAATLLVRRPTITTYLTTVGNVGGGEDDLQSHTVPANIFTAANHGIRVSAWGDVDADTQTHVRLYFGGDLVIQLQVNAGTGNDWQLDAEFWYTGTDAQKGRAKIFDDRPTTVLRSLFTATETQSAPIIVKVTGESADAVNDHVRCMGMTIETF